MVVSGLHATAFMPLRSAVGFLFIVTALAQPAVASDEIPSVLRDRDDSTFWIAADEAVRPDGTLDVEAMGLSGPGNADFLARLPQMRATQLKLQRRGAPKPAATWPELEGCEFFRGTACGHFEPTSSLSDLVTHADFIVSARIVAIRQGFLAGMPGSLMLLSTDYLKGTAAPDTYLFYPLARIRTNQGAICAVPLGSFVPPKAGDRLLIFSMTGGHWLEGRMVFQVDTARELVHEPGEGALQLPRALATLPRFEDAVAAVRAFLARR